MTWESVLSISSVDSGDYGNYDCIAQNEMGLARSVVVLNVTSRYVQTEILGGESHRANQ